MRKFITKGATKGVCNICGEYGPLTEDHTPPKGATRITQVEMHHIVTALSAEQAGSRGRISQNGVKFRTLCGRCNNSLLGANYDIAFNDFSQRVASYLKASIMLPQAMRIRGKPQKIARSLIGHLCAMGVDRYQKGPHTEDIRDFFLDPAKPLPDYLDIYYWLYPYNTQVLIRDAGLRNLNVEDHAVIWLMKFFPLAFLVVWDKPKGYEYTQFPNFANWRNSNIEDEVEMPIGLNVIPHQRWPEAPEQNSFLLYGDAALGVIEKPKRKN